MLSFEACMRHRFAKLLPLIVVAAPCLIGCSNKPESITNGAVSLNLNPGWTESRNPDGHLSLDRHFFKTRLIPWIPHPDSLSIRMHTECFSDEMGTQIKQSMTQSLFRGKESAADWFDVKTRSKPLSCLAKESFPSKDIPTDLLVCYSADGVTAVFAGRTFVQPEAIHMLQSIQATSNAHPNKNLPQPPIPAEPHPTRSRITPPCASSSP
jgi:hypothetical protein